MTFDSPEVRDAYHHMDTFFQHILSEFEHQFAYRGFHFHISQASGKGKDSEIIIRITNKPVAQIPADID